MFYNIFLAEQRGYFLPKLHKNKLDMSKFELKEGRFKKNYSSINFNDNLFAKTEDCIKLINDKVAEGYEAKIIDAEDIINYDNLFFSDGSFYEVDDETYFEEDTMNIYLLDKDNILGGLCIQNIPCNAKLISIVPKEEEKYINFSSFPINNLTQKELDFLLTK